MKRLIILLLLCSGVAFSQLVQKTTPTVADSVDLGNKRGPSVYADPNENDKGALKGATAEMKAAEWNSDSTVGTLIGVGAEIVGQTMKNILSPNSDETNAVELERQRR